MPIFRVTIAGRATPLLARADSLGKVKDGIVQAKALTAKELSDAFGEPVWTPGEPLPAEPKEQDSTDDGLIVDGKIDPVGVLRKTGEAAEQEQKTDTPK